MPLLGFATSGVTQVLWIDGLSAPCSCGAGAAGRARRNVVRRTFVSAVVEFVSPDGVPHDRTLRGTDTDLETSEKCVRMAKVLGVPDVTKCLGCVGA
jgi:hypothetical protein